MTEEKDKFPALRLDWQVLYNAPVVLLNYCFHKLATPGPSKRSFEKRSTLCTVSVLVTSFIFNLPPTSFVLNRACFCKLLNLHSKTPVHVRDHKPAWVGILTVIVFIQIDSILRGETHPSEETTIDFIFSQVIVYSDPDGGIFLNLSV